MASLVEALSRKIDRTTIAIIAQRIGAPADQTFSAVQAVLPMLVGALAKNSAHEVGAMALRKALGAHDGGILDDLARAVGAPSHSTTGDAILGHVLGGRRPSIEQGVSRVTGLDANGAGQVLSMLAPIVMAYLGKQARSSGMDAGRLASALAHASGQAHESATKESSALTSLLDRDGDGSIADDLGGVGGMLGNALDR